MPRIDYSLQEAFVLADGVPLNAWGPDDIFTVAWARGLQEAEDTADGFTVVSSSRSRRRNITVTCMQGGPGWVALFALKEAQLLAERTTFVFTASIRVGAFRVTYICPNASIMEAPDENYGRTAAAEAWQIVAPDVVETRVPI